MLSTINNDPFLKRHREALLGIQQATLALDRGELEGYRQWLGRVAATLDALAVTPNPYADPRVMGSFGVLYALCSRRVGEATTTPHRGRLRVVTQILERLIDTQLGLRRRAEAAERAA